MTSDVSLSVGRRRILDHLKLSGLATPAELAAALSLTPAAVRQHLEGLRTEGLVARAPPAAAPAGPASAGPGRPAARWRLTRRAHRLFPDRHGELTAQLIATIRSVAGPAMLDAVVAARTADQRTHYDAAVAGGGQSLREKAESLARLRTAEGYMAEVVPIGHVDDGDAAVLLIEHHCPICEAAAACVGFCRAEIELFKAVLGDEVSIEREEHVLSGGERCTYRLSPVGSPGGVGVTVGAAKA